MTNCSPRSSLCAANPGSALALLLHHVPCEPSNATPAQGPVQVCACHSVLVTLGQPSPSPWHSDGSNTSQAAAAAGIGSREQECSQCQAALPAAGPLKGGQAQPRVGSSFKTGIGVWIQPFYTVSFPREAEDAGIQGFISRPSETPHPSWWLTISRHIIAQKSNFLQHSLVWAVPRKTTWFLGSP